VARTFIRFERRDGVEELTLRRNQQGSAVPEKDGQESIGAVNGVREKEWSATGGKVDRPYPSRTKGTPNEERKKFEKRRIGEAKREHPNKAKLLEKKELLAEKGPT